MPIEVDEIRKLLRTHEVATTIAEVWNNLDNLLRGKQSLLVLDIRRQKVYPLTEIVDTPFIFVEVEQVMNAYDKRSSSMASFRIHPTKSGIIQIRRIHQKYWFSPSTGSIQLFIPKQGR